MAVYDTFWEHYEEGESGCWFWSRAIDSGGYGSLRVSGKTARAHVVAYTKIYGDVPKGLVVDHKCHTRDCPEPSPCSHRRCINPDHLQLLTMAENTARGKGNGLITGTHCPNGHKHSVENTYYHPKGTKVCRRCRVEQVRQWHINHPGIRKTYPANRRSK